MRIQVFVTQGYTGSQLGMVCQERQREHALVPAVTTISGRLHETRTIEREGKSRIGFFDDSTVACNANAAQVYGGELGSLKLLQEATELLDRGALRNLVVGATP